MAIYTLERGLVLQIGAALWEVHRLPDEKSVQLEHQSTGKFRHVSLAKLTHQIASGDVRIIRSNAGQAVAASVPYSKDQIFCTDSLKDAHKAAYLRASGYVRALRKLGISKGQRERISKAILSIAKQIGDSSPPRPSTVMRWMRLYERAGESAASLVTRNAHRRRRTRISDEVRAIIQAQLRRLYFVRDGGTLASVHDNVQAELERAAETRRIAESEARVSLSTIRRIAYEVTPYDRDRARLGPVHARAKWRFSTHGKYATRPLERVELDHTLLDLWVIDDDLGIPLGRPTITLLVCAYSGYITGFYISFEGESLARILRAIKVAIQPKESLVAAAGLTNPWHARGLWETLVVDNARACHSDQFKQMGIELCMDIEYCPVRQPWFKAVVERQILETCRQLPVPGRPQRPGRHPDPIDPRTSACITFHDLCTCILKWVVDVHPFAVNDRKVERPIDLFLEGLDRCPAPAFVDQFSSLEILAGLTKTATVDHSGIVFEWLQYGGEDLRRLRQAIGTKFKTTCKIEPYDLGHIFVQDPRDNTWIKVPAKDREYARGLTLTQHRSIRAAARERLRLANAEAVLRQAKLELQEQWAHAVRSGRRLKMNRDFVGSRNKNSVDVLDPRSGAVPHDHPDRLIADEDLSYSNRSIPTFDTFRLEDV